MDTPTDLEPMTTDDLGVLADRLDAALHATRIPMPDRLKIDGLKGVVIEVRDRLMDYVRQEMGDDPWDGNPTLFDEDRT